MNAKQLSTALVGASLMLGLGAVAAPTAQAATADSGRYSSLSTCEKARSNALAHKMMNYYVDGKKAYPNSSLPVKKATKCAPGKTKSGLSGWFFKVTF